MNHFRALTALFVLLGGPVHSEDVSKLKAVKASSKSEIGFQGNSCIFCRQRLGWPEDSGMETNLDRPERLVERAQLLTLTASEMTVLISGMRVLRINVGHPDLGVLTARRETLTNDFFTHLLSMVSPEGKVSPRCLRFFEATDRSTGEVR
jgi:hypothetical protein